MSCQELNPWPKFYLLTFGSKNTTGFGSRIAARRRPLAWEGLLGMTTCNFSSKLFSLGQVEVEGKLLVRWPKKARYFHTSKTFVDFGARQICAKSDYLYTGDVTEKSLRWLRMIMSTMPNCPIWCPYGQSCPVNIMSAYGKSTFC